MADRDVYRTVLPAGTVTAANGSVIVPVTSNVDASTLDVVVDIASVSGVAPTLTVSVERDAEPQRGTFPPTVFGAATSTAALNSAGRTVLSVPAAISAATGASPVFFRVSWTVGGTASPSFTHALYVE